MRVRADRQIHTPREGGVLNPPFRTPVSHFNVMPRPMHIHEAESWQGRREVGWSVFGGVRHVSRPVDFLIKVPYPSYHAYPLSD